MNIGRKLVGIFAYAALPVLLLLLPAAGKASAQSPKIGSIVTLAIHNSGNGWAWSGPSTVGGDGHLLRIENGTYHAVAAQDPAGAELIRVSPALYQIALAGKDGEGWAIADDKQGRPVIWHLQGGVWRQYKHNLPATLLLDDVAVSADGTDGWMTGEDAKNLNQYTLLRLRNGQWLRQQQPVEGQLQKVAISPNGKEAWGIGPANDQRDENLNLAFQWVDGSRWKAQTTIGPDKGYLPDSSALNIIATDNKGAGWTFGFRDESDYGSLIRLTSEGAYDVYIDLPVADVDLLESLSIQSLAVGAYGRGWVSGTLVVVKGDGSREVRPFLAEIDGTTVSEAGGGLAGIKAVANQEDAPYVSPLAVSPDGSHSWLVASDANLQLLVLRELREPWPYATPPQTLPLLGPGQCFEAVPHCLRGVFAQYWQTHGGLQQFGYPITPEVQERHGNTTYTVQYTERARLEYHPENKPPHDVLLGLLGNTLVENRQAQSPFKPQPASAAAGFNWFKETQHNVGPPFLSYWQTKGGLPVYGIPRSEAFDEKSATDGKLYKVQYFERNRLEYHPEFKGTANEILLGLLGSEQFQAIYGYKP